jgi:hypothetical protein
MTSAMEFGGLAGCACGSCSAELAEVVRHESALGIIAIDRRSLSSHSRGACAAQREADEKPQSQKHYSMQEESHVDIVPQKQPSYK